MKLLLKGLFGAIFLWMVIMTIRATLAMSIWEAWDSYAANPWAVATLWDAYCGFLTFFVWVCFKESGWMAKAVWFLLIMGLGNITMSLYVLIQLFKLKEDEPASAVLTKRA
ncbi:MAG: DUF1475 family protein [Acidobacteriota bacterium]